MGTGRARRVGTPPRPMHKGAHVGPHVPGRSPVVRNAQNTKIFFPPFCPGFLSWLGLAPAPPTASFQGPLPIPNRPVPSHLHMSGSAQVVPPSNSGPHRGPLLAERDYNHATDSQYKSLRSQADAAYDAQKKLSAQSQRAYRAGDKADAHRLSEQAKQQLSHAQQLNLQAAEYVFTQNNADSASNHQIDLHGLYVKEAQWILQKRIAAAAAAGEPFLHVIVGKGLHSANGVAKIKPAAEETCAQAHISCRVDPKNTGVLQVDLRGARVPAAWASATTYQAPQAPHYAQQQATPQAHGQAHTQAQQHAAAAPGNGETGGGLLGLVLQLVCMCVKNSGR
ncbi:LAMI_0G10506g1_1 [Lachancea mirantina]|uniref:LAMI_0G10506g1_1 n=1 Tax=Lachancea mirantina TaxID=1230905 RepID=A0A1G4KAU5_9SACH|nr:LAMI_0G10506g1_1 [Lachancea mirantina]